jgi:creatinine amidohydrolase
MARKIWWTDFSAGDFADIDPQKTIAIVPIAAIEQHGPHLPVGTDTILNQGCLDLLVERAPADLDLRIVPVRSVGKSNEHLWARGTVTHTYATLIDDWLEIGLSVARAGIKKLVFINSHGGNEEIMGIVAREMRVRAEMLAVKTSWSRFGVPTGLFSELEQRHGIHGGDIETSLMLHFRPDLVDMRRAEHFASIAKETETAFRRLGPTGTHAFAWIARDLNPHGVVGDASAATAEKGRLVAGHQARGFVELLEDVRTVPLKGGFASF